MSSVRTSVCIVGGGPAGLMLGLLLAKRGAEVVVLGPSVASASAWPGCRGWTRCASGRAGRGSGSVWGSGASAPSDPADAADTARRYRRSPQRARERRIDCGASVRSVPHPRGSRAKHPSTPDAAAGVGAAVGICITRAPRRTVLSSATRRV